ncbi:hypothetical protein TWF718_011048 [Orbilia javanica]|uniref:Azaphilone pigments biosynthesis cluster protein L N-terminal domain-containing protein n=1 Tax=Orbilia javanica TaxID=47235 RepID=A0AAN8RKC8_9PEZI
MDPLSITAGVFSLLSSLAALSMKINDFREDFEGAESEIRGLIEELDSLGLILKQLEGSCKAINKNLVDDLSKILQRLNTAVIEIQLFLTTTLGKKLRGPFWAFTGKKQCGQFCRRLEAYKSTLNITLTLASICSRELHERGDEILSSIHNTQLALPETGAGDEYVLQKYLAELETVYETSTAAGYWEDDTHTEVSVEPRKQISYNLKLATVSESPPSGSGGPQGASLNLHPYPSTTQAQSRGNAKIEAIAKLWESGKIKRREYLHPVGRGYSTYPELTAVRRENFAIWIRTSALRHNAYGRIIRGTMLGEHEPDSFELPVKDYWPEKKKSDVSIENREIAGLAFSDDEGSLIAVLSRDSSVSGKEYLIISWEAGAGEGVFKRRFKLQRVSPKWASLSPDGRFFASQSDKQVQIFDININRHLKPFEEGDNMWHSRVWSRNCDKLLVASIDFRSALLSSRRAETATINIYQTSTESLIFSATLKDLGFKEINHSLMFDFEFSGLDNNLTIVARGCDWGPSVFSNFKPTPKSVSKLSRGQTFWGTINLDDKTTSLKQVDKKGEHNYEISKYSGDGSYVFRRHKSGEGIQLVGLGSDSKVLVVDTQDSGRYMCNYFTSTLDSETNRIFRFVVRSGPLSVGMIVWEPES